MWTDRATLADDAISKPVNWSCCGSSFAGANAGTKVPPELSEIQLFSGRGRQRSSGAGNASPSESKISDEFSHRFFECGGRDGSVVRVLFAQHF